MQGFLSSGIFLSGASCDRCDRAWDLWWLLPDKDKSKLISRFFFFFQDQIYIYLSANTGFHAYKTLYSLLDRSQPFIACLGT